MLIIATFSSCNLVDGLVPDVDTSFTKTFQIKIFSYEGKSATQLVDVTTSEEYNDFKNNIEGFKLHKVTYLIRKDNVPEDMFFSGTVVCNNEEDTESYILGSIPKAKLADMALAGEEYTLDNASVNADKIISWLNSPGKFKVRSDYTLTNPDGTPYSINTYNTGSNFELVVHFYVKVKTKV